MKITLFIIALAISTTLFGQLKPFPCGTNSMMRKPLIDIRVKKSGPYFGLQRGKFWFPEVGVERQWKKVRLGTTMTHAGHMGFSYNLKYNVLGYDIGYWIKPHRIGLTYGGNLFYRTDFVSDRIGVAPVVGFKFWLLHFQTGYNFMARRKSFNSNTFFVSLRIGIINERDIEFKRKKKDRKN
jgi:hypothetical protein